MRYILSREINKDKIDNAYRLRGMATDSNFQRKGYASNLDE